MTLNWRFQLPIAGIVVGAWAIITPFTGPHLGTLLRNEIADHVVPGAVVVIVSALAAVLTRRSGATSPTLLPAGMLVGLAGVWMVATHVPLIIDATRDRAGWDATAYHGAPSLAVAALGVIWIVAHWADVSDRS